MAHRLPAHWESNDTTGLPRRDRRHGPYEQYVPDPLQGPLLGLPGQLGETASRAERAVRDLSTGPGADSLEGLARFLLRSEAVASSRIEGIAPSPQQVALAELAQDESVRGFSDQARLVANNMTVLRHAARDLAAADRVEVADIEALHRELLPDEKHHGLRSVQNWIGGSNWHPLDAEYVPPPPELVGPLTQDLVDDLNGAVHAPLIQAALVHAQFETIHPFTDGNGRVGRALIHTVLTRRGLTPTSLLPVSLVLATLGQTYVAGLTAYRYPGASGDPSAQLAVARWIEVFLEATLVAAQQAAFFRDEIEALRKGWDGRLSAWREAQGLRSSPRSDSVAARLLRLLPEMPLLTGRTVERVLSVSPPVARSGLDELADAGVLTRRRVERNTTGYLANEVLDVVGSTERQLASTRWDTRLATTTGVARVRSARCRPAIPSVRPGTVTGWSTTNRHIRRLKGPGMRRLAAVPSMRCAVGGTAEQ